MLCFKQRLKPEKCILFKVMMRFILSPVRGIISLSLPLVVKTSSQSLTFTIGSIDQLRWRADIHFCWLHNEDNIPHDPRLL